MKSMIISGMLALLLGSAVQAQTIPVYLDNTKPVEERIEDALNRMTLEEKVAMTHAQSKFCSPGVARLGIPEFWMTDGVLMVFVPKCFGMSGNRPDGLMILVWLFLH